MNSAFKRVAPQVDDGVVALLRDLLAQAQRGELLALSGIALRVGGDWIRYNSPAARRDPIRTLGCLRVLEMAIEREINLGEPEEYSGG